MTIPESDALRGLIAQVLTGAVDPATAAPEFFRLQAHVWEANYQAEKRGLPLDLPSPVPSTMTTVEERRWRRLIMAVSDYTQELLPKVEWLPVEDTEPVLPTDAGIIVDLHALDLRDPDALT
ncbi:MAG: hypothetical protein HYV19_04220 [Gemmatimonadetes bacterium]|nr:hypothetical protein [Gemmatimonadota bacterium]